MDLLESAGAAKAEVMINAIDDHRQFAASGELVKAFPHLQIIARAVMSITLHFACAGLVWRCPGDENLRARSKAAGDRRWRRWGWSVMKPASARICSVI